MLAEKRQYLEHILLMHCSDSVQSVEPSGDAEDGQVDSSLRDSLLDDREPVASINGQQ